MTVHPKFLYGENTFAIWGNGTFLPGGQPPTEGNGYEQQEDAGVLQWQTWTMTNDVKYCGLA